MTSVGPTNFPVEQLTQGVKFQNVLYVGTLIIKKSLTALSDKDRLALFRECMTRIEQARNAFNNGEESIDVEYDREETMAPMNLMKEYRGWFH